MSQPATSLPDPTRGYSLDHGPSGSPADVGAEPVSRRARSDAEGLGKIGAPPDHSAASCERELDIALPWSDESETKRFYEDGELHSVFSRASAYLQAGIPIRFQGPAGMGKTAMALRVARARQRPVAFLTGHDRMTSEDLIGRESGEHRTRLEDKYIASVRKTETRVLKYWTDGALLAAMTQGQTFVYDEFTRAPPEANVPLLSVLEEGIMAFAHPTEGRQIIRAHPEFRVLLTSNPDDYSGNKDAPDALLDRVVTFEFSHLSEHARSRIIQSATGIAQQDAGIIAALLSALTADTGTRIAASHRTGILIARLLMSQELNADIDDPRFIQISADVLRGRLTRPDTEVAVRQACAHLQSRLTQHNGSLAGAARAMGPS